MFAAQTARILRVVAVISVTALIALVTAFDYEASGLFFIDGDANPVDEVLASESSPQTVVESGGGEGSVSPVEIGEFAAPVDVIARPGDDRVFIVELMGSISATAGTSETQVTILDISHQTLVEGERGLLGAAFHPVEDLLYVHYSNLDGNSVIAEFDVDTTTGLADTSSERMVMTVEQPYANHNGGEVVFGPDGYLYVGFGDGGLADDPIRAALDLTSPLGKILRINPLATADASYTVPTDNPFVDAANVLPEIWSFGLRNPWKFSFDPATGDLWIADVGQNQWEEINTSRAADGGGSGVSFGWSAFEGPARFNEDQAADGHEPPFFSYERANGLCSVSGGAVARSAALPQLDGWFIYGDYCTGQVFGIDTTVAQPVPVELATIEALVAIAEGPNGELYAASVMGPVYRLG